VNTGMYSPKIKEELIPYLYRLAKHNGVPMTKLVNGFLEQLISQFKNSDIFSEIEAENKAVEELTEYFKRLLNSRSKKTAEVIELLRKVA